MASFTSVSTPLVTPANADVVWMFLFQWRRRKRTVHVPCTAREIPARIPHACMSCVLKKMDRYNYTLYGGRHFAYFVCWLRAMKGWLWGRGGGFTTRFLEDIVVVQIEPVHNVMNICGFYSLLHDCKQKYHVCDWLYAGWGYGVIWWLRFL